MNAAPVAVVAAGGAVSSDAAGTVSCCHVTHAAVSLSFPDRSFAVTHRL